MTSPPAAEAFRDVLVGAAMDARDKLVALRDQRGWMLKIRSYPELRTFDGGMPSVWHAESDKVDWSQPLGDGDGSPSAMPSSRASTRRWPLSSKPRELASSCCMRLPTKLSLPSICSAVRAGTASHWVCSSAH